VSEDLPIQWLDSDTVLLIERIDANDSELAAEEYAFAQDMRPRRLCEFAAGRRLARRSLAAMGETPVAIRVGAVGEPLWPSGIVGSISHTTTHVAVVMSRPSRHASVGIDLDDHRLLGEAAARDLMTDDEIQQVINAGWTRERSQAQNLVFCAKEALFKCQYPLTGLAQLDFEDVRLAASDRPQILKFALASGHSRPHRRWVESTSLHLIIFQQLRILVALSVGTNELSNVGFSDISSIDLSVNRTHRPATYGEVQATDPCGIRDPEVDPEQATD
jgi:4'-phosphopantetheinyl transferase EntD